MRLQNVVIGHAVIAGKHAKMHNVNTMEGKSDVGWVKHLYTSD
jgi:hypothetical protein